MRFISLSGWNKTSLSLDASEEHDGYSSAEDPLHSDAEDDAGKKLVSVPVCPVTAENEIPATIGAARADELRSLKLCLLCTACWQIHSEG